jgi:hypothetical protein
VKIALIHWPINNIGGILTWIREISNGFKALGHEVEVVCPIDHHPKKRQILTDDYAKGVPACNMYPIVTETELSRTMFHLNGFDLVIFCHPSPHPTKDQLSHVAGGLRWMDIYRRLTVPRLVVFHDNNWEKTNGWFVQVKEYVPFILAAQHVFMRSVARYPTKRSEWSYFPMSIPEFNPGQLRLGGLMATQWIRWKRHREFMEQLPELSKVCHFSLFNVGIEYFYLRKEELFKTWVDDVTMNPAPSQQVVTYHGAVPHADLLAIMQKTKFCIDFSKREYTNYTHWEPLCCGAYSFVHEDVFKSEYCELPGWSPMVIKFNDGNLINVIKNTLRGDTKSDTQQQVIDWCRDRMEPTTICRSLLTKFQTGQFNP